MKQHSKIRTIQDVSELLQLPKSTLRFWEKEFQDIIKPARTAGGQRRYTIRDVAVFEYIQELKKSGILLNQIKTHLEEKFNGANPIDPEIIEQVINSIESAVRKEFCNLLKL